MAPVRALEKAAPPGQPAPAPPAPFAVVRDAQPEERRLVTALFCDLVGFTPLTEQLDAEEVREIQTDYFQLMSAEVARYGGTVEKFAGDAVLALFGVPAAHEDDAERAILCALGMQGALEPLAAQAIARWGVELGLRVGVNTGEAVSGLVDTGGRRDFTVTGDVVNTAARLQTAARPGGIMAGAETMRLARRSIHFGEQQALTLKGKAATVAAYPVLGLRERHAERWEASRRTPLVGRGREVDFLLGSWSRARDVEGQLVMVVAEAGVGKSRLLAEVAERIASAGEVKKLEARCLSYGQDVSLSLVTDLLRSLTGVREQDEPARVQIQLMSAVDSLLGERDGEARAAAVDVFGEVLGLPAGSSAMANAGPQVRRQILIRSLRWALTELARRTPTLLVLEDLHWIDPASVEVLSDVLADAQQMHLLVLAAQRPGWTAPWSGWGWIERLNLRPLDDRDAVMLAAAVLGDVPLSPELDQYVAERAGGNPFFVEELLQALQETGGITRVDGFMHLVPAAAERLPSTLTEILLARLDRLEVEVRSLAQVASVVGRTFAVDLVAQVVGRDVTGLEIPLGALRGAEIAFPRTDQPMEYAFKHATIRDVAYNTLLQRRRQELHTAVARAIGALYPSDEFVEIIAYHYGKTEEHAIAAHWLERAGDRAADMYANQAAAGHYEEARRRLRLSGADEVGAARLGEKLGDVFRITAWYDESLEELEGAGAAYRAAGDLEGEARTAARIGRVHVLRGAREEGIRSIRDALDRLGRLLETDAPLPGVASLYVALVEPLYRGRQYAEALSAAERAVDAALRLGDSRLVTEAQVRRCLALQGVGRLDEARQGLEQVLPRAEAGGDLESVTSALTWLGDIALARGEPNRARDLYERALHVLEVRGDLAETAYLVGRLGQAWFVLGDWDLARAHFERAVELVRSISFAYFSAASLMTLGNHYRLQGDRDGAARYLEEPFTIAERSGQVDQLPYLHAAAARWDLFDGRSHAALLRLQELTAAPSFGTAADHEAMQVAAEALLDTEAAVEAERLVEEGIRAAAIQGNRLALVGWLRVRAMVEADRGRYEDASRALSEAAALAADMPFPYGEACALSLWGSMEVQRGQVEQGRERLQAALAIFKRLGAEPHAERMERDLAALTVA